MVVARVDADRVRSLTGVSFEPDPGLTVVIGPNGAGKTNLVESIYFGLTARSFRTSDRRDLIPFGDSYARCRVTVSGSGVDHVFMSAASRAEGNRFTMDGAAIDRVEAIRNRPMVMVFSPDRLDLVKGPPSNRRSHLDSFIAARWPSRAERRTNFGRVLAQRNALIARIAVNGSDSGQLSTWNRQLAETGAALAESRSEATETLSARWAEISAELGLEGSTRLEYRPGGAMTATEIEEGLQERLDKDLRLGRTSWGPHHDEVRLELNGRQLRRFGSQGQQRIGLLALLFAERSSLIEGGGTPPLMLLDDVMSELDEHRRGRLVELLLEGGQSVITAAEGELIPEDERISRVPISDLITGSE
ncbi:MAG: DNA replication and repair protein RecF [Solirubrobacterales bacterium]|nr:DNA replication and repair protein RecF [Solirubrobacterales bacterium]